MYKIKEAARRGSALFAAASLLAGIGASAMPALVSADALNPLTERSLTLSSSSPGFHYLDGSGNPTYAPPGSGNNGQKTGETFSFKVSTNSSATGTNTPLKGFTFQYCTTAAGNCIAPGDDSGTAPARGADTTSTSDLNAQYTSAVEGTDFEIYVGGGPGVGTAQGSGWSLGTSTKETTATTGKNNLITLTNASSTLKPTANTQIVIVFYASSTNYITNPGSGAFFVKINDYHSDTDVDPLTSTSIVDGGVTVANVMNDSIQIQTKVLETMSFSVGTVNPDADTSLAGSHGTCHAINTNAPINLGDPNGEYSLATGHAYDGYSYWRLSSNSSGGATVYYSGYPLTNTEGDHIKAAYNTVGGTEGDGSQTLSVPGSEQFGLAVEEPTASDTDGVIANGERSADTLDSAGGAISLGALSPLTTSGLGAAYADGEGLINDSTTNTAKFAFSTASLTTPAPIASETTDVIHCSTARMRYIANIAPDTPAGIYTSKINYIAAPQY